METALTLPSLQNQGEASESSRAAVLYSLLQRHGICQLAVALEATPDEPLRALFQDAIKVVTQETLAEPWSYLRSRDSKSLRTLTLNLNTELQRRASHA